VKSSQKSSYIGGWVFYCLYQICLTLQLDFIIIGIVKEDTISIFLLQKAPKKHKFEENLIIFKKI